MKSVKELRLERGWTVKELALKANVGENTIKGVESNGNRVHESSALLIADAFGVKVSAIWWPKGTTHLGKPAQSGGRLKPNAEKRIGDICHTCHETKPLHGECFSH